MKKEEGRRKNEEGRRRIAFVVYVFKYGKPDYSSSPRRYEGKKVVHEESIIVSEEIERIIIYAVL